MEVFCSSDIRQSNTTEEPERLWPALTAQIGTLSVGRDLGSFFWKILLFPLFLLGFPRAGEQLPVRGDFFCTDANWLYIQARSCSFLWDSQCRGTRPQRRRRRASVGCLGSQHYPPPCLPHGSWEEGGSSSSGAGLLDQGRTCVGKVGSHCGQCGLMQEEQMRISQLLAK